MLARLIISIASLGICTLSLSHPRDQKTALSEPVEFSIFEQSGKCSQEDVSDAQKLLDWSLRNAMAGFEVEVEYYRMLVNEAKACSGAMTHEEYCTAQTATLKVIETIYRRGASNPNLPEIYRLLPSVHIRNRMALKTRCG